VNILAKIDEGFVPFPEHEEADIPEFISPPAGTPDYLRCLWFSFLVGATGYDGTSIINRFRAETGSRWGQGANPIPRDIRKATGADRSELASFVAWFNAHVWSKT
jgi:hypothetical protein